MANISPGVYTKIIDLSTFVQTVPSTIGFLCGLSKKGRDNEVIFVGGRADFISEWGEPNIADYGKNFGQGPYIAYNFLGESGSLYWMRCLPDDAAFSNLRIDATYDADATSASSTSIAVSYTAAINTAAEMVTNLAQSGTTLPIGYLYPIGRGDYYNGIGVRFVESSNPLLNDVYTLDIYEKQADGDDVIIESFEVSFDPNAKDSAGDSLWIQYILETYSSVLRFEMVIDADTNTYTTGYNAAVRTWDKNIGTVTVDSTAATASITDNKQDFSDWDVVASPAVYMVIAKDAKGNEVYGWIGAASGTDDETATIYTDRDLLTRGWTGATANDLADFDPTSAVTYQIKKSRLSIATPFASSTPVPLKKGSDGSLINDTGDLDTDEAETLLQQGYSGLIDDTVLDPESIYFTIVWDAGYPTDVKTAMSTLVQTRRDCVAILDNGDNATVNAALTTRNDTHTFNNYYVTLYECFSKVSDPFTGQDVWFSPVYHMSYLLPRNDNVAEIWFAAAGFNRGAIDTIKELRFNPRLGQRDQLYLKQLNPIVKFAQGYVVWGQLTSQAKASALQDLNIVRLVLYCKRALEQFCRFFIFEQNDAITWGQVSGAITEFLEVIKQKRGLDNYSVEVSATEYERKTKTFHVNVTLDPTRVVEKIELNFFIK